MHRLRIRKPSRTVCATLTLRRIRPRVCHETSDSRSNPTKDPRQDSPRSTFAPGRIRLAPTLRSSHQRDDTGKIRRRQSCTHLTNEIVGKIRRTQNSTRADLAVISPTRRLWQDPTTPILHPPHQRDSRQDSEFENLTDSF
eukprot:11686673-Heterocapsa_arctica.AAC.1